MPSPLPSPLPSHSALLAERMRPRTLPEMVGQPHLFEAGRPLEEAIRHRRPHSLVAWGPPGSGKSSLIRVIARELDLAAAALSAAVAGFAEVRNAVQESSVLLIDEAHRLSPESQDALVHGLDRGSLVLATASMDPSSVFAPALQSRLVTYFFHPLSLEALDVLLSRAVENRERGVPACLHIDPPAREYLLLNAAGDARVLLDALDRLWVAGDEETAITLEDAMRVTQPHRTTYAGGPTGHYDVVTAFVKSLRGSDPDAALYWLACMLEAGEGVQFIARRLVIAAAEDVGLADPFALVIAHAVAASVAELKRQEARMLLADATVYVAAAPKSNAASRALERAEMDVRRRGPQLVPIHLRQRTLRGTPESGYGQGAPFTQPKGQFLFPQYLPDVLVRDSFYEPGDSGAEARVRERLRAWWPARY